jgi:hypothetical protein
MDTIHDFEKLEIPILAKMFTIYEFAHKFIFSLPKFERYTLGEKIEKTILDTIEIIVMANQSSKFEKERYLLKANAKIETLKLLYHIALNCKNIEPRKFLEIERNIIEAGKMAQGWIKYARGLK